MIGIFESSRKGIEALMKASQKQSLDLYNTMKKLDLTLNANTEYSKKTGNKKNPRFSDVPSSEKMTKTFIGNLVDEIFKAADTAKDGVINKEEFINWGSKNPKILSILNPFESIVPPEHFFEYASLKQKIHITHGWFNYIFVTSNGSSYAYDVTLLTKQQDDEVWKSKITLSDKCMSTVCEPGLNGRGKLYIFSKSQLICQDPKNGKIIWKKALKGDWYCLKLVQPTSTTTTQKNNDQRTENNGLLAIGNGYVHLIDKTNGKVIWVKKTYSDERNNVTSALISNQSIYAGVHGWVYKLSLKTGNLVWKKKLNDLKHTFPICLVDSQGCSDGDDDDDDLIVGSGGSIYLLDKLNGGKIKKELSFGFSKILPVSLLRRNKKVLIFGTNSNVYACNPSTLSIIWKNKLSGTGKSCGICLTQNEKYVYASQGGFVIALDSKGSIAWKVKVGEKVKKEGYVTFGPTMLLKNNLLYCGLNNSIHVLDPENGKLISKNSLSLQEENTREAVISFSHIDEDMDYNAQPYLQVLKHLEILSLKK